MTLEGQIHCEAPDCKVHAHVGRDTMEADRLPIGFWLVRGFGGNGHTADHHFCCGDCALKWLAASTRPPEIVR